MSDGIHEEARGWSGAHRPIPAGDPDDVTFPTYQRVLRWLVDGPTTEGSLRWHIGTIPSTVRYLVDGGYVAPVGVGGWIVNDRVLTLTDAGRAAIEEGDRG